MIKGKKFCAGLLTFITCALCAGLILYCGYLLESYLQISASILGIVTTVIDAIFLALFMFNNSKGQKRLDNLRYAKASDVYQDVLSKKDYAIEMYDSTLKEAISNYKKSIAKCIFTYICMILTLFLNGMSYVTIEAMKEYYLYGGVIAFALMYFVFFIHVLAAIFYGVYCKLFFRNEEKLNIEYETTYKMIKDIFVQEGITKKLKVNLISDLNAAIKEEDKYIVVYIGTAILKFFTKEEIKSIIYHEAAHYINEDTSLFKAKEKYSNILDCLLPFGLFKIIDPNILIVERENQVLEIASNIAFETKADDYVLKKNVGNAYASAEIKVFGLSYAQKTAKNDVELALCDKHAYDEEIIEKEFEDFREFYNKHKDFFMKCSKTHLEGQLQSHPNIKQRVEKFSDGSPLNIDLADNKEFDADILKLYKKYNKDVLAKEKEENWKKYKNSYDEYLTKKNKIIEDNYEFDNETAIDVMQDAYSYGDYDFAKVLGPKMLEKTSKLGRVSFLLGLIYAFIDFDDQCLPYLKVVSEEESSMFKEKGLQALSEYYTITGREEERNKIRENIGKIMDKSQQFDRVMNLSLMDSLELYKNDEIKNRIIELAKECDDIIGIVMGTKRIEEQHCHHVVLLTSNKIKDEKKLKDTYHKIWAFLDTTEIDDQFKLMELFNKELPANHIFRKVFMIYKK